MYTIADPFFQPSIAVTYSQGRSCHHITSAGEKAFQYLGGIFTADYIVRQAAVPIMKKITT